MKKYGKEVGKFVELIENKKKVIGKWGEIVRKCNEVSSETENFFDVNFPSMNTTFNY